METARGKEKNSNQFPNTVQVGALVYVGVTVAPGGTKRVMVVPAATVTVAALVMAMVQRPPAFAVILKYRSNGAPLVATPVASTETFWVW